jgi:hypothetical protein
MEEKIFKHEWEDNSYHGSPIWECRFCGLSRYENSGKPCLKAEEVLKKEADKKEAEEKWEYETMKKTLERFIYLKNKFGQEDHHIA